MLSPSPTSALRSCRGNLGTILTEDACAIRLRVSSVDENADLPRTQMVGEIDSIFADALQPGDRFVLDGRCLEMKERESAALLVEEVFGRPLVPRWLGGGLSMPVELARRIYLFRVQAAEALATVAPRSRACCGAIFISTSRPLRRWGFSAQAGDGQRNSRVDDLAHRMRVDAVVPGILRAYAAARSANEVLARVLVQRWQQARPAPLIAVAGDLGIYLLAMAAEPLTADAWRVRLHAERLAGGFPDAAGHERSGARHFTAWRKPACSSCASRWAVERRASGKEWAARRLYEQMRTRVPDFVLLRQTEQEAKDGLCDLPTARLCGGPDGDDDSAALLGRTIAAGGKPLARRPAAPITGASTFATVPE